MEYFRVEKCCCVFDLYTGGKFIFVFQSLCSAFTIFYLEFIQHIGIEYGMVTVYDAVATIIECSLVFIFSVLGFCGIVQERAKALIPWMIITCFSILLCIIASIGILVDSPDFSVQPEQIPILMLSSAMLTYFLICIYSLYKDMRRMESIPRYQQVDI